MHYRLIISRLEKIAYTEEALQTLKRERNSGLNVPDPPQYAERRILDCEIKEEELDCIKQALLKVWK